MPRLDLSDIHFSFPEQRLVIEPIKCPTPEQPFAIKCPMVRTYNLSNDQVGIGLLGIEIRVVRSRDSG